MPLRFGKEDQGRRSEDLTEVVEGDLERNGRGEDTGMRNHSKKLIDARPRNCPGDRSFGQLRHQPPGRTVMGRSDNLRIHQDVGVDCLRASATVHQIEEFVAIQQVDSGPLLRLPTAQLELERSPRFLLHKRLPKKLVGDVVKRAAFARRFLVEPL